MKKKNDRQPVIQIDFSFMATENDLPKRTVLNATGVYLGKDTEADEVVLGNACLQGQDCEKKIAFSTMECIVCHENGLHTLAGTWRWS